jgi:hypothetical protein
MHAQILSTDKGRVKANHPGSGAKARFVFFPIHGLKAVVIGCVQVYFAIR